MVLDSIERGDWTAQCNALRRVTTCYDVTSTATKHAAHSLKRENRFTLTQQTGQTCVLLYAGVGLGQGVLTAGHVGGAKAVDGRVLGCHCHAW